MLNRNLIKVVSEIGIIASLIIPSLDGAYCGQEIRPIITDFSRQISARLRLNPFLADVPDPEFLLANHMILLSMGMKRPLSTISLRSVIDYPAMVDISKKLNIGFERATFFQGSLAFDEAVRSDGDEKWTLGTVWHNYFESFNRIVKLGFERDGFRGAARNYVVLLYALAKSGATVLNRNLASGGSFEENLIALDSLLSVLNVVILNYDHSDAGKERSSSRAFEKWDQFLDNPSSVSFEDISPVLSILWLAHFTQDFIAKQRELRDGKNVSEAYRIMEASDMNNRFRDAGLQRFNEIFFRDIPNALEQILFAIWVANPERSEELKRVISKMIDFRRLIRDIPIEEALRFRRSPGAYLEDLRIREVILSKEYDLSSLESEADLIPDPQQF